MSSRPARRSNETTDSFASFVEGLRRDLGHAEALAVKEQVRGSAYECLVVGQTRLQMVRSRPFTPTVPPDGEKIVLAEGAREGDLSVAWGACPQPVAGQIHFAAVLAQAHRDVVDRGAEVERGTRRSSDAPCSQTARARIKCLRASSEASNCVVNAKSSTLLDALVSAMTR